MKAIMKEREMRSRSSESEIRLMETNLLGTDPYRNLASAIIAVAVDDYRYALRTDNEALKSDLKEFFSSDWYKMLTTIKPEDIIDAVTEEIYLEMHPAQ